MMNVNRGNIYSSYLSAKPAKPRIIPLSLVIILIIFLLSATVFISINTVKRTDQSMRNELLGQAGIVAQAVNIDRVLNLQGSIADLENPDYLRIKEQFARITESNDRIRFIYLMGINERGNIFFFVDNEPPSSADYSAPGDPYLDASDELISIFKEGIPYVEGPIIDAWGNWISALVPITEPEGNKVVALLGIDYDANRWRIDTFNRAALPVGMIISSFLLLSFLAILWQNRTQIQASRLELATLKEFSDYIVKTADEGIIICDHRGIVEFINPALAKMLGYREEELVGIYWVKFVDEKNRELALEADQHRASGNSNRYELHLKHKEGYPVPFQISASPLYSPSTGKYIGNLAVMTNISNLVEAEKAIRASEEKFRLIFERSPVGILHFDRNGKITDCNDSFVDIIGSSYDALVGLNMLNLPDQKLVMAVKKTLAGNISSYEDNYHSVTADKVTPVKAIFAPIGSIGNSNGKTEGGIGIVEDITERKKAEEKVLHMSFHDQLTGLYNRHYLESELKRLDTDRQLPISIIMADVNGLKLINDTYGHLKGDELLIRAANIISKASRKEDLIARWGGDEFVILLPQTSNTEASLIKKRIIENCQNEIIEDIPVSIALGTATKISGDKALYQTLQEAEDNMYEQKLTESRSTKSTVLSALLKALAAKSFETESHTHNMQEIAQKIGKRCGLPDSELNRLNLLITLHDIGKINIPEELLTKPEPLTDEEWQTMRKHPEAGYRIAMATEEFAQVAEEILCHHERWDGTGYPRGLTGNSIPLLARITAIADAYEVMNNGRPYKKPLNKNEIIKEFKKCSGSQFDPELVEHFLSVYENPLNQ